MLIFGAMPAYFDDIYFVHLDYYGGLDFKEAIISPSRPQPPVLEHLGIHTSYIPIPNPDADPVSEQDRIDKDIKIGGNTFRSLLLSPGYVLKMYDFPYVDKYETANAFVLDEDGTMNEHFKGIFARMLRSYMQFKEDADKIGLSQLEKFGAPIERAGRTVVPSLKETVYEPIELIRPKVFVRTRKGKEWFNNRAATRRQQKAWSAAKKTRRLRPNLRDNGENENN